MKHQDTVYIIGAGAVGKALAVFLKQEGRKVILLRGQINDSPDHFEETEIELNNNTILKQNIHVSTISNQDALRGIVVLTNKSYGNQQLAERLKDRITDAPIVILQNGLNIETPFISNGFPQIYRCVLFTSCQHTTANKLRFKPVATSLVGTIRGSSETLHEIINAINNPYLSFRAEENIQPVIWSKAIVNSVFNSVCPLLETDNGIFYRDEKALAVAKRIIAEGITAASLQGVLLNPDKVLETLLHISRSSDGQLISTYQDINNKRRTEIETLNLAIADIACKQDKEDTVKETKLLGELIQIKSRIAMNSL